MRAARNSDRTPRSHTRSHTYVASRRARAERAKCSLAGLTRVRVLVVGLQPTVIASRAPHLYHARMARRAQHLRCSLSERSERGDNKLDKPHLLLEQRIVDVRRPSRVLGYGCGVRGRKVIVT